MFCEAASAASVAGLLKTGVPPASTVVCVLTGHGLKDPDLAISQISVPTTVDAVRRRPRGPRPLKDARRGCHTILSFGPSVSQSAWGCVLGDGASQGMRGESIGL